MLTLKWFMDRRVARLILSEICQGALSKRQYSLELKNGQERFTFYAFISLTLKT